MPFQKNVFQRINGSGVEPIFALALALSFFLPAAESKPVGKPIPLSKADFELKKAEPVKQSLPLPPAVSAPKVPAPIPPVADQDKSKEASISVPAGTAPVETSFTSWPAKSKQPFAAIVSIHGFGLHKESFSGFATEMAKRGVSTYAIDVRGFGSWMGEPSEDKKLDFYQTMMDLRSAIYWVKTMNPGVPVFLLGESMGGAIALQATALFPECVSGLIASVPGAEFYGGKKAAVEVALRMVRPNSKFNVGEKVIEKATSDKKLRENWLSDPRARKEMTPKQMTQFAAFMNGSYEMARRIDSVPVLMLQGGKDKLSKADGTERLFKALKTPYKNYVLLDDAEHLIFEKGQYTARTADIVQDWLAKQAQRLRSAGFGNPR